MAAPTREDLNRYKSNLRDEVDGEALYLGLSEIERDPHLKEVFRRLAETEARHRSLWIEKLQEAGEAVPQYRPSWRVRVLKRLAGIFGINAVMPIVARMEDAAQGMYDQQPEAVERGLPRDERSHARVFREIGKTGVGSMGVPIARIEGRHRGASSNALRAAVLGANDGLVSNLLLVMGIAGGVNGGGLVLQAGVGGLLAGALSMALGEWISVQSAAEAFRRQLKTEAEELEAFPEEEAEELTLIYQAKGLAEDDARRTAQRILGNKETALQTLAREELGMAEEEAGNPWAAATTSFMTFAVGASLPVLPWLLGFGGGLALVMTLAISAGALFLLGTSITVFTGRNAVFSGGRMLVLGMVMAAVTYAIGAAIGSAV